MAGIAEDLEKVLQLGPDAEVIDYLDVASSILRKITTGDMDAGEAVEAALAIVNAVKSRLSNKSITGGSIGRTSIAASLQPAISGIRHRLVCKDQNRIDAANISRQLSGESRRTIIASASRNYDESRRSGPLLCDRRAWVDQTLREAGMPVMTESEQTLIPAD